MQVILAPQSQNRRFWLLYTASWILYAVSLLGVFVSVGFRAEPSLLIQALCNILPAFLMGIGIVHLCRELSWKKRKTPLFIFSHSVSLLLFPTLWIFLTLFGFTVLNFLKSGVWNFATWDKYALQWQFISGLMAYMTIVSAVYIGETNRSLQFETRRRAELEIRAARAEAVRNHLELVSIRAQLNPHFLFNTLHSLMALVRHDADKAEEGIEKFALMLRYVLQAQTENHATETDVTFADEWLFIQNYLELENLRLGERLKIESAIEPEALNFKLPAFSVQPLVENSIKYAIAPRTSGGTVRIKATVFQERLHVEIGDDGNGATPEKIASGGGLGLRLVRENLAARFGNQAAFDYRTAPGEGFIVRLEIPKIANDGDYPK